MTTPYNPPKPNRTAGDKLRGIANKLNDGNKLGICSLLLVAGLAVTLAVMAQDYKLVPREKQSEIRADYLSPGNKSQKILVKTKKEDVLPENHTSWDTISKRSKTRENAMFFYGQLHSLNEKDANPHALIYILTSNNTPYLGIVPQDICTDEGWATILQLKARPDFAERWGYKIPTSPNEVNIAGSGKPFDKPEVKVETPVFTQPTMPIERTITNTQGVAIEGTILAKTDTSISFQRKGNGKPIDIKLDLLSADDQAYIATLVDKKSLKPTVLFVTNQDYEVSQELRTWLTNSGFEVILGFMSRSSVENSRENLKVPSEQKAVVIDPFTVVDQFDVVWIHRFSPADRKENSDPALVAHRNKNRRLVVIPTHSRLAKKDRFLSSENYYAGSPKTGAEEKAFMKIDENIIFCSNKAPFNTDEEMREKLLIAIKEQLAK